MGGPWAQVTLCDLQAAQRSLLPFRSRQTDRRPVSCWELALRTFNWSYLFSLFPKMSSFPSGESFHPSTFNQFALFFQSSIAPDRIVKPEHIVQSPWVLPSFPNSQRRDFGLAIILSCSPLQPKNGAYSIILNILPFTAEPGEHIITRG